jgi:aspartate carbamoyltransferase catalytic subunit
VALLDAFTLRERWGSLDGKVVTIVGDIRHSRVFGSDVYCLRKLGAKVRVCGPPTMIPIGVEKLGCEVQYDFRRAVEDADAVMLLRIQTERLKESLFPNGREYAKYWGLDEQKLSWMKPDALVLHPGPVNRGVEVAPAVADGVRSVILDQVENGVAVRMAILLQLLGGSTQG